MDLAAQFIAMGIPPDQAKQYADNFVKGLTELGLSDVQTTPPTPDLITLVQKNNPFDTALLKVGVRPTNVSLYRAALDSAMTKSNIGTKNRKAMFLAQVLHESNMLSTVTENLNYSEKGLLAVFGRYFNSSNVRSYARNPQKIANRVYASRMGNGNEASGDGWKFRGRGLIQLTGKENYINCGKSIGVDLVAKPDHLATPAGAAASAAWFWNMRGLNKSADAGDIRTNTKLINGGFKGLDHRTSLYQKLLPLV